MVVHFNYVDTAYGRQARRGRAAARARGAPHPGRHALPRGAAGTGLRAARQAGIRATLATGDVNHDPEAAVADSSKVMGDAVDAFEGPNELDNAGDPGWPATLSAYMPRLAEAVRRQAPGVPVIGPSFIDPANRDRLPPDLPGSATATPIPAAAPPEAALGGGARDQAERSPAHGGLVFTETGYHNALRDRADQPPASEEAAAVYFPRLLLDRLRARGAAHVRLRAAGREARPRRWRDLQQHFGLLRNDFSPKPAFTAIKTLIAAIRRSPGPAKPRPAPDDAYAGAGADDVTRLTLVRRDGSRVVALWRPVSVWDRDSGAARTARASACPSSCASAARCATSRSGGPARRARPCDRAEGDGPAPGRRGRRDAREPPLTGPRCARLLRRRPRAGRHGHLCLLRAHPGGQPHERHRVRRGRSAPAAGA